MVRRCPTPAKSAFSRVIFVHFSKKRIHFLASFCTFSVGKMSVVQDYPTRSRLSYTPSYTRSIQYFLCLLHSDVECVGLLQKFFVDVWQDVSGCTVGTGVPPGSMWLATPPYPPLSQPKFHCVVKSCSFRGGIVVFRGRIVTFRGRIVAIYGGMGEGLSRGLLPPLQRQPIAAVKRPLHFTYSTGFTKCGKNSKVKKQEKNAILYYLFVPSTKIH